MAQAQQHTRSHKHQQRDPLYYQHVPKNLLLILLSLITLPLSAALVLSSLVYSKIFPPPKPIYPQDASARKTILVTGVSMTKGLAIARILAQHTPHRIIGADISALSPGRFSSALSKYYVLTPPVGDDAEPYVDALLHVIKAEKVDLWISCSSVVAAVEDGEVVRLAEEARGSGFRAVQYGADVVERLHEKDQFVDYVRSIGQVVPESYRCTSRAEVLEILLGAKSRSEKGDGEQVKKKFILKPIGVDDRARANMMTLLPFQRDEDTAAYVRSLDVSRKNTFQVQQYIGGAEYCTHALVIRGVVVAFTCCPSLELLMHYEAIPSSSPLFKQMLEFTRRVAEDGGETFTGHLSFDFLADGEGNNAKLYPIECNPRAHTAVILFSSTPHMASAYLSAFSDPSALELVVPRSPTPSYYWIGHDLVSLLILPILDLIWGFAELSDVIDGMVAFGEHVGQWRDGTFEVWDPVPFLVLNHVYWPMKFVGSLLGGKRWSRVNVSTTKIFET